jgi:hypothetical protein
MRTKYPVTVWMNMEATMLAFMERVRAELKYLQRSELPDRLKATIGQIHRRLKSTIRPDDAYLLTLEPFYSTIRRQSLYICMTDSWEMMQLQINEELYQSLPKISENWKLAKDQELISLLSRNDETPLKSDVLDLATTFFKCNKCAEPIAYPRILMHQHITNCDELLEYPGTTEAELDVIEEAIQEDGHLPNEFWFRSLRCIPWSCQDGRVDVYPEAEAIAKSLVTLCGLDVNSTAANDMDILDPVVECLHDDCSGDRKRRAMRWRRAVRTFTLFRGILSTSLHRFYTGC